MKKKLIGIFIIFACFFVMCGCDLSNNKKSNNNTINDTKEKSDIKVYYKDNESINLFINEYNKENDPDITSEMISKKHIKGSDRDDVVTVSNDKLEINIYENYKISDSLSMSVYVGYKPQIQNQNEDFKEQFIKYIRIFDNTLTNDEIENYWNDMISEYRTSYNINDIEVMLSISNGKVSYFKLTSKMKFE